MVRRTAEGEALPFLEKKGSWYKLAASSPSEEQWIHERTVLTAAEHRVRAASVLSAGHWAWRQEHGYAIAEGQVTNVSDLPLRDVTAVVTFKTASGQFITTDDALVDFNPILPGQTSAWKVMATWNPEMRTAYLEFKTLFGGTLPFYSE